MVKIHIESRIRILIAFGLAAIITTGGLAGCSQNNRKSQSADSEREACDDGDMQSCFELGVKYQTGEGENHDIKEAARLWRKACDGGDIRSCSVLGWRLVTGVGTPKDITEGKRFLQKGCDGGHQWSCERLAGLGN